MKVLFLTRSTVYTVFGGDTVQVEATAKYLRKLGVEVDIRLADERIDYALYDLIHVFNVIRPADSLLHLRKSRKPYLLSTIYVDFSEYEREHRTGIAGIATRLLSGDQLEYLKAVMRMIRNGELIRSPEYLRIGHRKAVRKLAAGAAMLLPNSRSEMERFSSGYGVSNKFRVVYNGIDEELFSVAPDLSSGRDKHLVLCVARIEGKKNQLNLIRALNNTPFELRLIGSPAPNHRRYYEACRAEAGPNVRFEGFVPQQELHRYYRQARVHILPSWNETCGLSSLEAAYYGCNIVITDKGDTREYYGQHAWYCNPGDPDSIRNAVMAASEAPVSDFVRERIGIQYNWRRAAADTLLAYESVFEDKQLEQ